MSEDNRASETNPAQGEAAPESDTVSAEQMEQYREAYKQRWMQRMQIIAGGMAAFLLYMIWFMMHE